ncbi:AMP-binding protein (plasmid) [Polymorphobacter sp. PAMC 29334]|uniref:AMP-binding protein n=1 Tax=Polymorphobacter sp. PAMC 29334 TaxID=2862331 RepID=UPI001C799BC5|nr:AMP-binding protein [Polymorphobacter sp. PAMC 29334]QYE33324.1 AMP-binding protein [Polymorphobacter sp. PAMC 29334]
MNDTDLRDLGGGTLSGLIAARARQAPDNVALVFEGTDYSYGDIDRATSRVAAGFLALGLAPDTVVATFMTNRPEYLFTSWGINRAGLIGTSVNTGFKAAFLLAPIERAEAAVLVTEQRLGEVLMTVDAFPATLKTIVFIDGVPDTVPAGVAAISWDDFLAAGDPDAAFPARGPGDTAAISFTSGTTGRSKGVVSPNLMGLVMGKESAAAFQLTPSDRLYTCMPLFHGMAQVTTGIASLYAGATMILARGFSASGWWDDIRRNRATQSSALGSMLHMVLAQPPSEADRDHQVTRIFSAPAPADILYRFERRFGVHLIEGYGSTEIKNCIYNPIQGRKIGAMGKATPSSDIEVHDIAGNRCAPGQVGELVYRPRLPNIMMKGYFREPEKTLEGMRGLWWHTGDMAIEDEDGFFWFYDRTSDRLRRRGENISSMELEGVVSSFPGITEAAAVAVRSDVGEDEVLAVIETRGVEIDWPALVAHCAANMPRFMVPRYYRAMPVLPRTPTGKVQKNDLREQGLTGDTFDHVEAGIIIQRQA